MSPPILIDAGPLVAYLQRNEQHHAWVVETTARLRPPLLTCEPVLAEAAHLLRRGGGDPDHLLELLDRGLIETPFQLKAELARIRQLMRRYHDTPMSLADACLVRMAETVDQATVLTLDTHFRIYRRLDRLVIPTLLPPGR